eukprot:1155037-Pelagomonas_calceolata.AAC.4
MQNSFEEGNPSSRHCQGKNHLHKLCTRAHTCRWPLSVLEKKAAAPLHPPAHKLPADDARDAAFLQDLSAHVEGQVTAVHHALDEVQVPGVKGKDGRVKAKHVAPCSTVQGSAGKRAGADQHSAIVQGIPHSCSES